ILSAKLDQRKGKPDAARKQLAEAAQAHPDKKEIYLAWVLLEIEQKEVEKALEVAQRGLKALPEEKDLVHALAILLLEKGKIGEVEPLIAQLAKASYEPSRMDYLKARIHSRRSEWSPAEQILA